MRIIIVAALLSGVMLILLSGCEKSEPKSEKVPYSYLVEKGIEQAQPKVITMEGKEILYIPNVSVSNNNFNLTYRLYKYENGQLVNLPMK